MSKAVLSDLDFGSVSRIRHLLAASNTDEPLRKNEAINTLAGQTDVLIASLGNGQVLAWNAGASRWENVNQSGGGGSVATLTDVNLTSLANGQFLQYNSGTGKWVNVTLSVVTALASLTDVSLTTLFDGQYLQYNASASKWKNVNGPASTAFTAAPTAPGAPSYGDRWVNTSTGIQYTWFNDGGGNQWVQF